MGASALSGQPPDTWRPSVVSPLLRSTFFPAILVGPNMKNINNKNKKQIGKSKSKRSCKSDDEETAIEVVAEPRVLINPCKKAQ